VREMGKFYHMHLDLCGFLRQHPKPTKKMNGLFHDDDGRPMTSEEAWHKLKCAKLEGKTGIPLRGCDNFNPKTGECLGHECTDDGGANG